MEVNSIPIVSDNPEFATDYICREIPWKKIDLDCESVVGLQIPFKKATLLPKYLKPNEHKLWNEISEKLHCAENKILILERNAFTHDGESDNNGNQLFTKSIYKVAKEWCKTNEELAKQEKEPILINFDLLSAKFSKCHQQTVKELKRLQETSVELQKEDSNVAVADATKNQDPIRTSEIVEPPPPRNDIQDIEDISANALKKDDAAKANNNEKLHELFDEMTSNLQLIKPKRSTSSVSKMQYQLIITDPSKIHQQVLAKMALPKRPWKKNIYPPKTFEERIEDKRAKAAPLPAEYLELDYLPGIWEPQLLIKDFRITSTSVDVGADFDIRRPKTTDDESEIDEKYEPVNWHQLQLSKERCFEWLNKL